LSRSVAAESSIAWISARDRTSITGFSALGNLGLAPTTVAPPSAFPAHARKTRQDRT
jgi:hypothetical protein